MDDFQFTLKQRLTACTAEVCRQYLPSYNVLDLEFVGQLEFKFRSKDSLMVYFHETLGASDSDNVNIHLPHLNMFLDQDTDVGKTDIKTQSEKSTQTEHLNSNISDLSFDVIVKGEVTNSDDDIGDDASECGEMDVTNNEGTHSQHGWVDCEKPSFSYPALITMAIKEREEKKRTLRGIYQFIQENFPYYEQSTSNWQNSIRHTLSVNKCFVKVPQEGENGDFWTVLPADDDVLKTEYNQHDLLDPKPGSNCFSSLGTLFNPIYPKQ